MSEDRTIEAIDRAIASIDKVQATLLEIMAALDAMAKPVNVVNYSVAPSEGLKALTPDDLRRMWPNAARLS